VGHDRRLCEDDGFPRLSARATFLRLPRGSAARCARDPHPLPASACVRPSRSQSLSVSSSSRVRQTRSTSDIGTPVGLKAFPLNVQLQRRASYSAAWTASGEMCICTECYTVGRGSQAVFPGKRAPLERRSAAGRRYLLLFSANFDRISDSHAPSFTSGKDPLSFPLGKGDMGVVQALRFPSRPSRLRGRMIATGFYFHQEDFHRFPKLTALSRSPTRRGRSSSPATRRPAVPRQAADLARRRGPGAVALLPAGGRAHLHIYPKHDISEGSCEVELMRWMRRGREEDHEMKGEKQS